MSKLFVRKYCKSVSRGNQFKTWIEWIFCTSQKCLTFFASTSGSFRTEEVDWSATPYGSLQWNSRSDWAMESFLTDNGRTDPWICSIYGVGEQLAEAIPQTPSNFIRSHAICQIFLLNLKPSIAKKKKSVATSVRSTVHWNRTCVFETLPTAYSHVAVIPNQLKIPTYRGKYHRRLDFENSLTDRRIRFNLLRIDSTIPSN